MPTLTDTSPVVLDEQDAQVPCFVAPLARPQFCATTAEHAAVIEVLYLCGCQAGYCQSAYEALVLATRPTCGVHGVGPTDIHLPL